MIGAGVGIWILTDDAEGGQGCLSGSGDSIARLCASRDSGKRAPDEDRSQGERLQSDQDLSPTASDTLRQTRLDAEVYVLHEASNISSQLSPSSVDRKTPRRNNRASPGRPHLCHTRHRRSTSMARSPVERLGKLRKDASMVDRRWMGAEVDKLGRSRPRRLSSSPDHSRSQRCRSSHRARPPRRTVRTATHRSPARHHPNSRPPRSPRPL